MVPSEQKFSHSHQPDVDGMSTVIHHRSEYTNRDYSIVRDYEDEFSVEDIDELEEEATERDEEAEVRKLISRETRNVKISNDVVSATMILVAVCVTVTTFSHFSRQEDADFRAKFAEIASEVANSIDERSETLLLGMINFVNLIKSVVDLTNSTWPFVTIPDFTGHVVDLQLLTRASGVILAVNVHGDAQRAEWEAYSVENDDWYSGTITPEIFTYTDELRKIRAPDGQGVYVPGWQVHPATTDFSLVNWDLLSHPQVRFEIDVANNKTDLGGPGLVMRILDRELSTLVFGAAVASLNIPVTPYLFPIQYEQNGAILPPVAYAVVMLEWTEFLEASLPSFDQPIYVVLSTTCDPPYTWEVTSSGAILLGQEDLHERRFDGMAEHIIFTNPIVFERYNTCSYRLSIYPTATFEEHFKTAEPGLYTLGVGLAFGIMGITFLTYDLFVQKRNAKIMSNAARSNAIVTSLFPGNIRDRLFEGDDEDNKDSGLGGDAKNVYNTNKGQLRNFLSGGTEDLGGDHDGVLAFKSKPIADFFLATTVMFADIVGFTAWSSVREPSQVFTLLETLYAAFDQIAKKRRIFKVETVGDCYVAVAGLPDPRRDHALIMARFARDSLYKSIELFRRLEVLLGPDTGDLGMRIGLHSGPVTAGVLRGERSRFQLFGDTMNTAARIESGGARNQIHISEETAKLLASANKSHWYTARDKKINAKGKGEIQTYWLDIKSNAPDGSSVGGSSDEGIDNTQVVIWHEEAKLGGEVKQLTDKTIRLIDWNVEIMLALLKQIVARRNVHLNRRSIDNDSTPVQGTFSPQKLNDRSTTPLDEFKEIIVLPEFNSRVARLYQEDPVAVEIPKAAVEQLQDFITTIAHMYRTNDFHNFEHASHVTMSVTKLLSRIVAPTELEYLNDEHGESEARMKRKVASKLHDHTYGITSDPLTQYAVVFSAMIHDVDHVGVPNARLIQENAQISALYNNKSVAEQNSIDLAWNLLLQDRYKDLLNVICPTKHEYIRFRQLVVNTVLATDIADKDFKALRNARWDKAFKEISEEEDQHEAVNRKATIVIEHLIQASDVAHTMQHWHIYTKWNERFFRECYKGFIEGRAEKDPSVGWYKGEMGFYDFYIIPLAKKLKDCGVFGVSSEEYLNYAVRNREEWELRGEDVVAEMLETIRQDLNLNKMDQRAALQGEKLAQPEIDGSDHKPQEYRRSLKTNLLGGSSRNLKGKTEAFLDEESVDTPHSGTRNRSIG